MDTGTPNPTEELNRFLGRIVTEKEIPLATWLEGVELFRLYVVKEIFPHITLHTLSEDEDFHERTIFTGAAARSRIQGFYSIEQTTENRKQEVRRVIWGLARNGKWFAGDVIISGYWELPEWEICLEPCSLEVIITSYGVWPQVIMSRISKFVDDCVIEKTRRLHRLRAKAGTLDTFAKISSLKFQIPPFD